jgi:hypothetical protein
MTIQRELLDALLKEDETPVLATCGICRGNGYFDRFASSLL